MNLTDHLKWNPLVPLALLAYMAFRAHARGFPVWAVACLAGVAVWLLVCVYRALYRRSRRTASFPPLSEAEVVSRIGQARMDQFLPGRFGFVWISEMITKYGYPVGMMFRDEPPDKTFSGWTFISGEEDDWRFGSHVEPHDAQAILRCDPAIEKYLDLPVGASLSRQADGTFVKEEE